MRYLLATQVLFFACFGYVAGASVSLVHKHKDYIVADITEMSLAELSSVTVSDSL